MEEKLKSALPKEGFRTAAEVAYNIISEKILNGELEPGCKLSRRKMAELAGVSVIPVIEALNRLEEDGLVESKPQWGSYVTVPTLEKIKGMYVLREAIECQVARILAQSISPENEKELRHIASVLDNAVYTKDNYEEITQIHYEFHSKIAESTGYYTLVNTLRRINLFWILYKAVSTRREKSTIPKYWHMRLLDEILSGDPDRAERMMRIHIYDSLDAIVSKWDS